MLFTHAYNGRRALTAFLALALLLSAAALLSSPAQAYAPTLDMTGRGVGFTSVLYDNASGLPTSEANAIVQSGEGFIWIGSYSGLIRYDGNEFERVDASTGVASVMSLLVDSKDRIWVGTNDSGVAVLEGERFTFYTRSDGLRSSSVHALAEDEDGNILVATTMGLAYVDTEGVMSLIDDPQVNQEYICELVPGAEGVVYGVTNSGAIFTVEKHRITAFYSAEDMGVGTVYTLCPDPDNPGFVYLGTQGSEIIYGDLRKDLMGKRTLYTTPQKNINAIHPYNGLIWICADNGIGFFDENYHYVELQDLPLTNSIDHMIVDFEGNLWFTSSRQGVMKIVENRFTDISGRADLKTMVVNTTCSYRGDLYIGTDNGLVVLDGKEQLKETALSKLLEGARIRCIRADSAGKLWLCTYSDYALVCYDGENDTWESLGVNEGMASNRVRTCMELADGTLAVATNAGMNLLRDGKVTQTYDTARGISNLEILCLEQNDDGRIYLGSDGDGIYIVDGNRVSRLGLDDGLRSEVILRMKKDPEAGVFWIVTSNSLAFMRDDKITTIKNFPYTNNFDVCFDTLGRIWVLCSNGIYVVERENLLANGDIEYTHYDTSCGLPCIPTANSYSQLDPDGTLYIAGSTGVCSVNINDDAEGNSVIRLAVPFIRADDSYVPIPDDGTVRIPSECKRLTIYPYAFTYSLNNPHVSYWLEGFDEAPVTVTRRELGEVRYTNLDGGTYRFRLSVVDVLTGEAKQSLTVTIVKEKAIFEQLWFWIVCVAAALALVIGTAVFFSRRKTRALERKDAANRQLIHDISSVFAKCIDMKDHYTNGHSTRVAKYASMLAAKLGKSAEEVDRIYNIALLHDVGKIGIPDEILNKPGRLTDDEFKIMKGHSWQGHEILKDIPIAPDLADGAGYHHEKYNGTGYPRGLKGDEIPEVAQIIAVADTFDAMHSTRPYRKQMEMSAITAELRRVAGEQLNPEYVKLFLEMIDEGLIE